MRQWLSGTIIKVSNKGPCCIAEVLSQCWRLGLWYDTPPAERVLAYEGSEPGDNYVGLEPWTFVGYFYYSATKPLSHMRI